MLKLVTKRCKGCGICVNFCPKKVLEVTEVGKCAIIKDKEKDCIQCGQCEMRCPDYAILWKSKGVRCYVQSITVARQPGSSRRRHRGRR